MVNAILLFTALAQAVPPALEASKIVERLVCADDARRTALAGYTGLRRYRLENKRFNKRAELTARVVCERSGAKRFEVLEESGSGFVRRQVLRKMIEAEQETSAGGEREQTRITPANYDFRLVGTDDLGGRMSYVLEIVPKTKNRYLVKGRIWVDAEDFAITRIEGEPAKNPSFWTSKIRVLHLYEKAGRFWLPSLNQSHAEVKIFGRTDVTIEYHDYQVQEEDAREAHLEAGGSAP